MRTSPSPVLVTSELRMAEPVMVISPAPVVTMLLSTAVALMEMLPSPVEMVESATVLEGTQPSAVASQEEAR